MMSRLPLVAAIGAVLLLTACGPAAPITPTAPSSGVAAPTPSVAPPPPPPSATPTPTPTPSAPSAGSVITAGTCTAAEMAHAQTYAIPVVYTVYTGDSTSAVTIQYMAFNFDGTNPVQTLVTHGPVVNILAYPCNNASVSNTWILKASHNVPGSIGCVIDFGGLVGRTDSQGQEDPSAHINCSDNFGE
jgi:hypothetical protein